uniref:Replication associated protein n=1 Tax=unidentified TaxID=32644 RepID=A0A6G9W2A8_9ZZZZ|nr:replication associated protein [unidentified]
MAECLTACFCFTLNNYTEEDVGRLLALPSPYVCFFGKEVAPSTGTPHLQGMLWRDDDHRFKRSTAEHVLGGRAFLTPCRDFDASMGYCAKEGDFYSNRMTPSELATARRLVAAASDLSNCNYWLGSALQHIEHPDDFLSDVTTHYHSHVHCARCPKH